MARIVIIGASTGGMPAAYNIRQSVEKTHKVTVISNSENFHFVPSNPWIAVGWRSRDDISFKIEPYLTRKNIDFIPALPGTHVRLTNMTYVIKRHDKIDVTMPYS